MKIKSIAIGIFLVLILVLTQNIASAETAEYDMRSIGITWYVNAWCAPEDDSASCSGDIYNPSVENFAYTECTYLFGGQAKMDQLCQCLGYDYADECGYSYNGDNNIDRYTLNIIEYSSEYCAYSRGDSVTQPGAQKVGAYVSSVKCHSVECGDGVIEGNEECDDGNRANGDGCSYHQCKIADGWSCYDEPSLCFYGEVCHVEGDEDNLNGADCLDPACDGGFGPDRYVCEHGKELTCNDGYDNDADSDIDCDDPDCRSSPTCLEDDPDPQLFEDMIPNEPDKIEPDKIDPADIDGNIIFVSSVTTWGDLSNLGGLEGADATCQGEAESSGLPGTYIAFISSNDQNIKEVLTAEASSDAFYNARGEHIADDVADLFDGDIGIIKYLANGDRPSSEYVWTGTLSWGGNQASSPPASVSNCNSWTSKSANDVGVVGDINSNDVGYGIAFTENTCNEYRSLYCVEVPSPPIIYTLTDNVYSRSGDYVLSNGGWEYDVATSIWNNSDYGNDAWDSVSFNKLEISESAVLSFESKFYLEGGKYDNVYVLLTQNLADEYTLGKFPSYGFDCNEYSCRSQNGYMDSSDWPEHTNSWVKFEYIMPDKYIGEEFEIQFRLDSDGDVTYDGVKLRNIQVRRASAYSEAELQEIESRGQDSPEEPIEDPWDDSDWTEFTWNDIYRGEPDQGIFVQPILGIEDIDTSQPYTIEMEYTISNSDWGYSLGVVDIDALTTYDPDRYVACEAIKREWTGEEWLGKTCIGMESDNKILGSLGVFNLVSTGNSNIFGYNVAEASNSVDSNQYGWRIKTSSVAYSEEPHKLIIEIDPTCTYTGEGVECSEEIPAYRVTLIVGDEERTLIPGSAHQVGSLADLDGLVTNYNNIYIRGISNPDNIDVSHIGVSQKSTCDFNGAKILLESHVTEDMNSEYSGLYCDYSGKIVANPDDDHPCPSGGTRTTGISGMFGSNDFCSYVFCGGTPKSSYTLFDLDVLKYNDGEYYDGILVYDEPFSSITGDSEDLLNGCYCTYGISSGVGAAVGVSECMDSAGDDPEWIMFVSANKYPGNLGGISGANAICQADANAANLAGTFIALLSSSEQEITDELLDGSYVNTGTDGSIVAASKDDLFSCDVDDVCLDAAVQYTASGVDSVSASNKYVWTGSNIYGSGYAQNNCNDWSSGGTYGVVGRYSHSGASVISDDWIAYFTSLNCRIESYLYCVQVSKETPDEPECIEGDCDADETCVDGVCVVNAPDCGNGAVDAGEQCDGTVDCEADCTAKPGECIRNLGGTDYVPVIDGCAGIATIANIRECKSYSGCMWKVYDCRDGILDAGEGCDDGNDESGDGCSYTCAIESDYECSGEPSVCEVSFELDSDGDGVANDIDRCANTPLQVSIDEILVDTRIYDDGCLFGDVNGPDEVPDGCITGYDLSKLALEVMSNLGCNDPTMQQGDVNGPDEVPDGCIDGYDISLLGTLVRTYQDNVPC
jgi:cysteine-rich repeat protein